MRTEYKRDINGNYLVLYETEEPDTSSYQVRMLVGNIVPFVLKCKVQGIDGQFMVCFDITSKQSVATLYEEKKIGYEDLQMILGGFVQGMEEMSEYLLNPGNLVVKPEYMYVDLEKRQLYFCYLPGYEEDVRQKFQELTEYILPRLDHEDQKAVMLGYGVYRRALEDTFHLEYVKKELYQERENSGEKNLDAKLPEEEIENPASVLPEEPQKVSEADLELLWREKPEKISGALKESGSSRTKKCLWKIILECCAGGMVILVLIGLKMLGYLPRIPLAEILGGILLLMGIAMAATFVYSMRKPEKESGQRKETEDKREKNSFSPMEANLQMETNEKKERPDEGEMSSAEQGYFGETTLLSSTKAAGPASLVSKEPGELATIYLKEDLTVIGKMATASDAVIDLPTVSRMHAKIRKRDQDYYLTDLNSRNGTAVNGKLLKADEEYCLQDQDEVDFAQARYVFLK